MGKQGVPVTTIIHLQLLKGELRDRVHTAQSCGDISSPGMHSTIIELTLPGFDRVESKLKITTNSIDTRNLLHMAVLLLNEVYLMEDALWHDVRGVSSEEDEMTRLVTLLRGYAFLAKNLWGNANSSSPADRHPLIDDIGIVYSTLCCLGASLIHQQEFDQAEIYLKKAECEASSKDSNI